MAIELGQVTKTFSTERRTWRFQIDSPKNETPVIELFREQCDVATDGTFETTIDPKSIRLSPQDLPGLASFFLVPPELQTMIPDAATAATFLTIMPALLAIACDAADKKRIAELSVTP